MFNKKDEGNPVPQEFWDKFQKYMPEIDVQCVTQENQDGQKLSFWMLSHNGALVFQCANAIQKITMKNLETGQIRVHYGVEMVHGEFIKKAAEELEKPEEEQDFSWAENYPPLYAVSFGDALMNVMKVAPKMFIAEKLKKLFEEHSAIAGEHTKKSPDKGALAMWQAYGAVVGINFIGMLGLGSTDPDLAYDVMGVERPVENKGEEE
tara:strand:- start:75041 stop:75661 length:621 start_codon:yes stop_codon:yes gene_type:complete